MSHLSCVPVVNLSERCEAEMVGESLASACGGRSTGGHGRCAEVAAPASKGVARISQLRRPRAPRGGLAPGAGGSVRRTGAPTAEGAARRSWSRRLMLVRGGCGPARRRCRRFRSVSAEPSARPLFSEQQQHLLQQLATHRGTKSDRGRSSQTIPL